MRIRYVYEYVQPLHTATLTHDVHYRGPAYGIPGAAIYYDET